MSLYFYKPLAVGVIFAAVSLSTVSLSSYANSINFDGTGALTNFTDTSELTNFYAGQGVNFAGLDLIGGSILNQGVNFGFNALSGSNFLAFDVGFGNGNDELITFDSAMSSVSIWAASSVSGGSFTMKAFDARDQLLSATSILASSTWTQLSLTGSDIFSVIIIGAGGTYAYDDLDYTQLSAVPVPAALPLMFSGLGALGIARRNKKNVN